GKAGIAQQAEGVPLDLTGRAAVAGFCRDRRIDLVVVGPAAPLCAGIVDDLESAGVKAFGPSRAAARLEGSKGFTKDLCRANQIPTAAYERFADAKAAKAYIRAHGAPIVVKADGDRKSTRLNSSHLGISYAVFCLKKKKTKKK